MARKRRRFTPEFKARVALEALRERDSVQAIARRHELHPNQVSNWKRQLLDTAPEVFAGGGRRKLAEEHEAKVRELHAKIGELTVERDFFRPRARALSRAERVGMIERDGPLSLSRQCALLKVSRSSQYYRPKGESAENLALMRRMDELHMAYPFYGSRQMMRHLRPRGPQGGPAPDPAAHAGDGDGSDLPAAEDERGESGAPDLPLSVAGSRDLAGRPRLVCGHHLCPCHAGVFLSRGRHGLGDPARARVAAVEHDGRGVLRGSPGRRAGLAGPGDSQHGSGRPVHQRGVRGPGAGGRAWRSRWTAGAASTTTSSSNGCGGR